jgi:hypothetical protein
MTRRLLFRYANGVRQIAGLAPDLSPTEISGLQLSDGRVITMRFERATPTYVAYTEVVPLNPLQGDVA